MFLQSTYNLYMVVFVHRVHVGASTLYRVRGAMSTEKVYSGVTTESIVSIESSWIVGVSSVSIESTWIVGASIVSTWIVGVSSVSIESTWIVGVSIESTWIHWIFGVSIEYVRVLRQSQ